MAEQRQALPRGLNLVESVLGSLGPGAGGGSPKIAKAARAPSGEARAKIKEALEAGSTELDISSCDLIALPEAVLGLAANLVNLNLSFNRLQAWPEVSPYKQLEELVLSGNQLTEVGSDIGNLVNLKRLFLNGNRIAQLPREIGFLQQLEKLDLGNNQLKELVPEIGLLTRLEELSLTGNLLTTVPASMGRCVSLEILDLSCCQIEQLPSEFTLMTRLLELNLGTNNLQQLPSSIGRMTRLVTLNLCDNQLQDLPVSMGMCGGLKACHIERNPIRNQELWRKYQIGTDHLVDYLEKRMMSYKSKRGQIPEEPTDEVQASSSSTGSSGSGGSSPPQLDEKVTKLRDGGHAVANDIQFRLGELKKKLARSGTLEELVPLGHIIKRLKPEVEKAKLRLPQSPEVPRAAAPLPGEDKAIVLKRTIATAITEVEAIVQALQRLLARAALPKDIVALVQSLRAIQQAIAAPLAPA